MSSNKKYSVTEICPAHHQPVWLLCHFSCHTPPKRDYIVLERSSAPLLYNLMSIIQLFFYLMSNFPILCHQMSNIKLLCNLKSCTVLFKAVRGLPLSVSFSVRHPSVLLFQLDLSKRPSLFCLIRFYKRDCNDVSAIAHYLISPCGHFLTLWVSSLRLFWRGGKGCPKSLSNSEAFDDRMFNDIDKDNLNNLETSKNVIKNYSLQLATRGLHTTNRSSLDSLVINKY